MTDHFPCSACGCEIRPCLDNFTVYADEESAKADKRRKHTHKYICPECGAENKRVVAFGLPQEEK